MDKVKIFFRNQNGCTFTSSVWTSTEGGQVGEAGGDQFGAFCLFPMAYATENKQADYSVTSFPICL